MNRNRAVAPLDGKLLTIVKETIYEGLGGRIDVSTLSTTVGLSRSHFSRAFRKAVGESPHAHIFRLRIERAKQLMRDCAFPLSEIALAAGFSDQAHFSNAFRRSAGTTPSQWRRSR
jgi:AraC family transcriptional regulator